MLALSGHLHDFDVGAAAQPTVYGAMPATLFPSPGTAVRATVLWVTPAQFTQLAWSELSYRLGKLRCQISIDHGLESLEQTLAFVSRLGAFCVDGEPVALAAIPATGRRAVAMTQEQLLDIAAALALGRGARAEALVRMIFKDLSRLGPALAPVRAMSMPFASGRWTEWDPGSAPLP